MEEGWRKSHVGKEYGGATVQGILPYYFFSYLKGKPVDDLELPRCKYNNMDEFAQCKAWPIENVSSNHFTGKGCTKAFYCGDSRTPRCQIWLNRWRRTYEYELRYHRILPEVAEWIERDATNACGDPLKSLSEELYRMAWGKYPPAKGEKSDEDAAPRTKLLKN